MCKKQKRYYFNSSTTTLLIAGLFSAYYFNQQKIPNDTVQGQVTNVVHRPNRAEDGYYGITVHVNSGDTYTIDATGYLNTPTSSDRFGKTCVYVPKVKVGDSVEFNLPKAQVQHNTYDICYKKNKMGYFFKQT